MNLLKTLFANPRINLRTPHQARRRCRPEIDELEARLTPSRTAVLDFDGEYVSKAQMQTHYASDYDSALSVTSFRNLFTGGSVAAGADRTLDIDGNGTVDGADADLAIGQIVAKVRQDYAPYDLNVVIGDQDTYQSRMTDALKGDVIVMIGGGYNNVDDGESAGIYGIAPVDGNNVRDDYAFVFGKSIADDQIWPERFINHMARTISHEMGHTFGLRHIIADDADDASTHHLMNVPDEAAGTDDRDFSNDFAFQDRWYDTTAGYRQNAHTYLSESLVLGRSTRPWAAVLSPGMLTIQSAGAPASFWIMQTTDGRYDWTIINWSTGVAYHLDPDGSPDVNSLNPFDQPITYINFYGSDYNDALVVDNAITATVWAFGNGGNDTLYGGGGNDYLYGGSGNDQIYGQGGADLIFGESGNDYLDGGHDHVMDYVYGGYGSDTLVQHRHQVFPGSDLYWRNEDYVDFQSGLDTLLYRYWWE